MPNAIFQKLAGLNYTSGKTKKTTDKLYYRISVNNRYVTDYKLYDKETAETEAVKLGGKVDRTMMTKREFDNFPKSFTDAK